MQGSSEEWAFFWVELTVALLIAAGAVVVALVALRLAGRRSRLAADLYRRIRWPLAITVPLAAAAIALNYLPDPDWSAAIVHALAIGVILSGAWLAAGIFLAFVDYGVERSDRIAAETSEGRRVRTQLRILRRVGLVLIVVLALGSVLMTFEVVRAVGVTLLASAGISPREDLP